MKGIYVLVIKVEKVIDIDVGALGKLHLSQGLYVYVGSAQTDLETRLKRHLRKHKRKFWHIDYLLEQPEAKIVKIFMKKASKPYECTIARKIAEKGETVTDFGSSDCNCQSHLVRVNEYEFLGEFMKERTTPSAR